MHLFLGFFSFLFLAMFAVAVLALLVFALMCLYVYRYIKKRKMLRKMRLAHFRNRLNVVVAELLKDASEVDEASRYVGCGMDTQWQKRYADALKRLIDSADKLKDAENWLGLNELNATQECLLYVVRQAQVSKRALEQLRPDEASFVIETKEVIVIKQEFE
jgi:hypothetical protein